MNKASWKLVAMCGTLAILASLIVPADPAQAGTPWRSSLYPPDWTPGYKDAQGRFLQDFSYAGYWRGEKSIPEVPPGNTYNAVTGYGADPSG
ncbi:hypothetical protein, partial [Lysinibacillus sp. GbtcB16]|uniref:hypothetical protein n=1 Tax=Lysinibacillus sp. GbtcB16 TaxID=2824761 RepID=UPI001C3013AE